MRPLVTVLVGLTLVAVLVSLAWAQAPAQQSCVDFGPGACSVMNNDGTTTQCYSNAPCPAGDPYCSPTNTAQCLDNAAHHGGCLAYCLTSPGWVLPDPPAPTGECQIAFASLGYVGYWADQGIDITAPPYNYVFMNFSQTGLFRLILWDGQGGQIRPNQINKFLSTGISLDPNTLTWSSPPVILFPYPVTASQTVQDALIWFPASYGLNYQNQPVIAAGIKWPGGACTANRQPAYYAPKIPYLIGVQGFTMPPCAPGDPLCAPGTAVYKALNLGPKTQMTPEQRTHYLDQLSAEMTRINDLLAASHNAPLSWIIGMKQTLAQLDIEFQKWLTDPYDWEYTAYAAFATPPYTAVTTAMGYTQAEANAINAWQAQLVAFAGRRTQYRQTLERLSAAAVLGDVGWARLQSDFADNLRIGNLIPTGTALASATVTMKATVAPRAYGAYTIQTEDTAGLEAALVAYNQRFAGYGTIIQGQVTGVTVPAGAFPGSLPDEPVWSSLLSSSVGEGLCFSVDEVCVATMTDAAASPVWRWNHATVRAVVTPASGQVPAGSPVTAVVNGVTYTAPIVNGADGSMATFTINLLPAGAYPVTVSFLASRYYKASSRSTTLTIW